MSYLGYIKTIFDGYPLPSLPVVIEIGVDQGHSTLPIIQNLASRFKSSVYLCCDIKFKQIVGEQFINFNNVYVKGVDNLKEIGESGCHVFPYELNSLDWLANMTNYRSDIDKGFVDIAFVDGDHNYYTVSNELKMIKKLLKPEGLIVCDDYNGKWANRDGFYSEAESHKDIAIATKRVKSKKEGIMSAVQDFLAENKSWSLWTHSKVDPAILYNLDVWEPLTLPRNNFEIFARCKFKFVKRSQSYTS